MNTMENKALIREAQCQSEALKRIGSWRSLAVGVSTIGAALIYAGFAGSHLIALGILGILLMALGVLGAVILNQGLRNGRRNVEHILNAAKGRRADEL